MDGAKRAPFESTRGTVTINGRIFPREDIDIWTFPAKKGQTIRCEVHAARLGSPLDAAVVTLDGKFLPLRPF